MLGCAAQSRLDSRMVGWLPNPNGIVSFSPALDDASRPTLGRRAEMNTTLKGLNPFRVRRPRDSRMVGLVPRRVARPRIEDGGQHHFILQIGNSALARARENFRCRQSAIENQQAGSSVGNGSGTMPAQTTIWYAVLINQAGRAETRRIARA